MKTIEQNFNRRKVLVTGGLGFIGFNALQLWKKLRPNWKLVVVDNETYAAQFKLKEKKEWCRENGIDVECFDISDPFFYQLPSENNVNHLERIIQVNGIDTIVNFAAESHVDNSISGPEVFFKTNVIGTVNLLEAARKHGLRYHQISTDEVYGETDPDSWTQTEHDFRLSPHEMVLKPSSPYSSSKASADLITLSYCRTFGLNATVSRCSNNFGPWQHPEKLFPTVCRCVQNGKKVPVYGDGKQKRQWIFVDDHNLALIDIIENGQAGKIYNISSEDVGYMENIKLIEKICRYENVSFDDAIEHVKDRLGHDTTYFIYNYFPFDDEDRHQEKLDKDIEDTVQWYIENL